MLPTKRSAIALARGARTGVLMMRTSMAVKTASNAAMSSLDKVASVQDYRMGRAR